MPTTGVTGRHYDKAPIVDAVIDLRLAFSAPKMAPTPEGLLAFAKAGMPDFTVGAAIQKSVNIDVDGAPVHQVDGPVILRLKHKSLPHQCVLRSDGLAYTHQPPYSSWIEFSSAARRAFKVYNEQFKPQKVLRYALRYVNRIELGVSECSIQQYFSLYPNIPNEFPRTNAGMFMQMQFRDAPLEHNEVALINMGTVDSSGDDGVAFVLDMDLFGTGELTSFDDVWNALDRLSKYKNALFESSITDKTRGLFI